MNGKNNRREVQEVYLLSKEEYEQELIAKTQERIAYVRAMKELRDERAAFDGILSPDTVVTLIPPREIRTMKWIKFEKVPYNPFGKFEAPFDGKPFLACIWGNEHGAWVAEAVYTRHYDSEVRGKHQFFCVAQFDGTQETVWEIRIETDPFPITHWMPLPEVPNEMD